MIELQAGATFAGFFALPAKACAPGQWIILRSDGPHASLPAPGVRIDPPYTPLLPQLLVTPDTINQPALAVAQSAANYRLMFLEVAVSPEIANTKYAATDGALIDIDLSHPYSTTAEQQPHNIIVDRVLSGLWTLPTTIVTFLRPAPVTRQRPTAKMSGPIPMRSMLRRWGWHEGILRPPSPNQPHGKSALTVPPR